MEELKTARAQAKYVRIAPRKVQIICDMIRGKEAAYAQALMENTPKAGCEYVGMVLKIAVANDEINFEMDPAKLYGEQAYVDAGPILKRGQPRAHGRMFRINKRTSHISVVLDQK